MKEVWLIDRAERKLRQNMKTAATFSVRVRVCVFDPRVFVSYYVRVCVFYASGCERSEFWPVKIIIDSFCITLCHL